MKMTDDFFFKSGGFLGLDFFESESKFEFEFVSSDTSFFSTSFSVFCNTFGQSAWTWSTSSQKLHFILTRKFFVWFYFWRYYYKVVSRRVDCLIFVKRMAKNSQKYFALWFGACQKWIKIEFFNLNRRKNTHYEGKVRKYIYRKQRKKYTESLHNLGFKIYDFYI